MVGRTDGLLAFQSNKSHQRGRDKSMDMTEDESLAC